jgi:hypothetical protein
MSEKEIFMFSNKEIPPTDERIFSILGKKKCLWQDIMNFMKTKYPDASGDWNYYNDGKQWLLKMVLKKKTIFWGVIMEDTFRITFYFGDKAEPVILASSLPDEIKEGFVHGKRYGKIRAISMKINNISDIEIVKTIILIKVEMRNLKLSRQ